MKRQFFTYLCAFALAIPVLGQGASQTPSRPHEYPFNNPQLTADQRIDNLISLMTIDEKIDFLGSGYGGSGGGIPRLGVPSIGSSEGIHGVQQAVRQFRGKLQPITTTQFPQPPGMGAS